VGSSSPEQQQQTQNSAISQEYNYNGTLVTPNNQGHPLLDSQIFSLVLQAWKNSEVASLHSALRAHNLLVQMAALADRDVLCDPPLPGDYLAVLECWFMAADKNTAQSSSIELVVQHVQELWDQMRERQRRDRMMNTKKSFEIDVRAYELFASLLARAGKASRAEQVVDEAVAQLQIQQIGCPEAAPNYAFCQNNNNNNNKATNSYKDDFWSPKVDIGLCHAVLRAHLVSKESRAPERAQAFLQHMTTDPYLPNPTVESYNLLLERWLATSKATKNNQKTTKAIAKTVEGLIHQMKEQKVQPNLVSYQYAIDAIARSGEAVRAETMLAKLLSDYLLQYDADLKPNLAPFHSVLWGYSIANRKIKDAAPKAESVLKNMKELSAMLDTYPTVWSYNIILKCWANSFSPDAADRAIALFEDLSSFDTTGSDESDNVNNRPKDLKPDTTSINTVLSVLSKSSDGAERTEDRLWKFCDAHEQDPKRHPRPDAIAFSTAITAWTNSNDPEAPDRAEALVEKLTDLYCTDAQNNQNYKPDVVTYTNLMQTWIKSKNPEGPQKSETILRELQAMEREGDASMRPDAACWNSVISAWTGDGDRAEALFLEMMEDPSAARPTAITLTNVLKAWAQTKSPDAANRAVALLAKMENWYRTGQLSVKPNAVHYSVVLDALAYARTATAAERAEAMLRGMEASDDPKLHPNAVSYNCVIKAWSYSRDPRSANKITGLLRELIDHSDPKLRPNENTFGTILKFLADSDLPTKEKRARATAIQNLMKMFLDREPKPWIRKELGRCLDRA